MSRACVTGGLLVLLALSLQMEAGLAASRISCFNNNISSQKRNIIYADGTRSPVLIPYPAWTSARITAEVAYILLNEVMDYNTDLVELDTVDSGLIASAVAGCPDHDCECINPKKPRAHFSLMTGVAGAGIVSCLPTEVQPSLALAGYHGDDTYFLWQDVIDAGLNSANHISLDYFRSYNAQYFKPHVFFDHWNRIFELLPRELIIKCSDMSFSSLSSELTSRNTANYILVTGDTEVACSEGDSIWFSPACRRNTSECIPVLIRHNFEATMQHAYFLNLPFAVVLVAQGTANFAAYYSAARAGRFLFHVWMPDDNLVDANGRLPVMLNLPRSNDLEHSRGYYKTGFTSYDVRNYIWRDLPAVDSRAHFLAASLSFFDEDLEEMMNRSHHLRAGQGVGSSAAARSIACEWVKGNEPRWRAWIPRACAGGAHADVVVSRCDPCPAGSYCAGGFAPALACPDGFYCPPAASAPTPCPSGSSTASAGAVSAHNCSVCADRAALLIAAPGGGGGTCVPYATLLPAIVLPLAAAVAAAAALFYRWRIAEEEALWRIKAADIACPDPVEVLGRGARSCVVRASYRGTPVAVKHYVRADRDGSGGGGGLRFRRKSVSISTETAAVAAAVRALAASGNGSTSSREECASTDETVHASTPTHRSGPEGGVGGTRAEDSGGGDGRRSSSSGGGGWAMGSVGVSRREMHRSMKMLTGIRHPCIVTVMGVTTLPFGHVREMCLVSEIMELGSLWDLLHNHMFALEAEFVHSTLQNVAQGLRFLHEASPEPLLHGDLKSPNVLIDRNFVAKLSDISLPRSHHPRLSLLPATHRLTCRRGSEGGGSTGSGAGQLQAQGPLPWMAPECLLGAANTAAADMYSYGVVIYECLTRRAPFDDELSAERRGSGATGCDVEPKEDEDLVAAAKAGRPRQLAVPGGCSIELVTLMNECLQFEPALRPRADEVDRRISALDSHAVTSPALVDGGGVVGFGGGVGTARRMCRRSSDFNVDSSVRGGLSSGGVGVETSSEAIMRSMFPGHVADALLRGEKVPPEAKDMITMYFSDIVGFTTISSSLAAEKVSEMLDRLYQELDNLAESHGVYKLEIIGDAYLCATNLVATQPDHAARMARFGLAAVRAASAIPVDPCDPSMGNLKIRVGLHSGPCMASVVGRKNPKYTLFGDTINVASRMESTSIPGRVQCSRRTADLVAEQDATIRLERRGEIEIKGKGTMVTYWIPDGHHLDEPLPGPTSGPQSGPGPDSGPVVGPVPAVLVPAALVVDFTH